MSAFFSLRADDLLKHFPFFFIKMLHLSGQLPVDALSKFVCQDVLNVVQLFARFLVLAVRWCAESFNMLKNITTVNCVPATHYL